MRGNRFAGFVFSRIFSGSILAWFEKNIRVILDQESMFDWRWFGLDLFSGGSELRVFCEFDDVGAVFRNSHERKRYVDLASAKIMGDWICWCGFVAHAFFDFTLDGQPIFCHRTA